MKIGLIHTKTTIVEKTAFAEALQKILGVDTDICHYERAELLAMINQAGKVTQEVFLGLLAMYEQAVKDGCEVVLSTCTAAGPAAKVLNELAAMTGVPVVSVEAGLCEKALACGKNIAIVGTSGPAMQQFANYLHSLTPEALNLQLLKLSFAQDATREAKAEQMAAAVQQCLEQNKLDMVVLAQPSLAFAAAKVQETTGVATSGPIQLAAEKVQAVVVNFN